MGVSVDIHSQAYIDSLYDLEPDYTPPSTAPMMEEEAEEEPASTSNSAGGSGGEATSSVTNQSLLTPPQAQMPGLDTTPAPTEAGGMTPGPSMATRKQEMPVESVGPVAQETLGVGTPLERLVLREATWPSYAERFGARGDSWQGRGRTAEEILACYNENFRETTAPPTSSWSSWRQPEWPATLPSEAAPEPDLFEDLPSLEPNNTTAATVNLPDAPAQAVEDSHMAEVEDSVMVERDIEEGIARVIDAIAALDLGPADGTEMEVETVDPPQTRQEHPREMEVEAVEDTSTKVEDGMEVEDKDESSTGMKEDIEMDAVAEDEPPAQMEDIRVNEADRLTEPDVAMEDEP